MIDDVFAVIADQTRRQILRALSSGKRPVGSLVEELGVSQPTVSKHLKVLRNAGLVETEAVGQKRLYSLTPEPLHKVTLWIDALTQAAEDSAPAEEESPHTSPEETSPVEAETLVAPSDDDSPSEAELAAAEEEFVSASELPEATETDEAVEISDPVEEEPNESVRFEMGEEAKNNSSRRSSTSAISFTPLAPFTPTTFNSDSENHAEISSGVESEELAEVEAPTVEEEELLAEETGEVATAQNEVVEPTENVVDQQAPVTQEDNLPPELPTASAEPNEHESRGLLATLSRWGRRRQR